MVNGESAHARESGTTLEEREWEESHWEEEGEVLVKHEL